MTAEDFGALVTLIRNIVAYEREIATAGNDGPRIARAYREQEEAIEIARSRLVL